MRRLYILVAAFAALSGACRVLLKEVVLARSVSPDGLQKLVIAERIHGPDASLEINMYKGSRVISVYKDRADRAPSVIDVYWSADSRVLGILVCDPISAERRVVIGYDAAGERLEGASGVEGKLRVTLIDRYSLTPAILAEFNNDPIGWACSQSSGAQERFRKQLDSDRNLPAPPSRQ